MILTVGNCLAAFRTAVPCFSLRWMSLPKSSALISASSETANSSAHRSSMCMVSAFSSNCLSGWSKGQRRFSIALLILMSTALTFAHLRDIAISSSARTMRPPFCAAYAWSDTSAKSSGRICEI